MLGLHACECPPEHKSHKGVEQQGAQAKSVLFRLRMGIVPLRIATGGHNEGSDVGYAAPGERLGPRGIAGEDRSYMYGI